MRDDGSRRCAARVFALAAAALALLWFLPSVWARADWYGALLFLALPAGSGWAAGWALGGALCAPPPGYGPGRAVMTGAAVASLAILMFALLFSAAFVMGPGGTLRGLGRGASVVVLSVTALGPVILLVGATTGLFLFRYGRRAAVRVPDGDGTSPPVSDQDRTYPPAHR